ncbi:unnamed protein product [Dovyalis caffra]|uniref:Exostosin GT47 domain-containing protein n=1 Tax=Dovyalis caffra TaxID=77055 RepID=A0AAV1SR96_9ROSI|nr:unnamed protein product [Dovyalis caffra]
MMQPYVIPRFSSIWTRKNIQKMILLVSVVFVVSQLNLLWFIPQFKDSLPGGVRAPSGKVLFRGLPPQFMENGPLPGEVGAPPPQNNSIGSIYHREAFFLPNYEAMMRDLKIFVYPNGIPTERYNSKDKLTRKYASEHQFMKNLERTRFFTFDATIANLFLITFSCIEKGGKKKVIDDHAENHVKNHVKSLIFKYPYWNRTLGADHFFFSSHDIDSWDTEEVPFFKKNAIRLVNSPSYDSKYIPRKDIALPQTLELSLPPDGDDVWSRSNVKSRPSQLSSKKKQPPRTKLGFWAGFPNSDVRKNLQNFYKGVPEFDFHFIDKMKKANVLDDYQNELYGNKFCICPRGKNQVGGVCLTESITFGCVPVILSDYYDLPFNDILDWNNFSVIIKEDNVPSLEKILEGIPEDKYKKMLQNVLQVRKHFNWNSPPVKYGAFHMVMYELWLRRHTIKSAVESRPLLLSPKKKRSRRS